jgi:hypothetical protein
MILIVYRCERNCNRLYRHIRQLEWKLSRKKASCISKFATAREGDPRRPRSAVSINKITPVQETLVRKCALLARRIVIILGTQKNRQTYIGKLTFKLQVVLV